MKVAIDRGPLESGHAVRGIGVNTNELIKALQKDAKKNKNFQVDAVNFSKTDLSKYDIAHHTAFHPYFLTLPKEKTAKKSIVTIHDLIYLIYPDKYPAGIKGKINFFRQKQRIKNVDAVVTISETSKKDIIRFLPVGPEKVHVVYLAPKEVYKPIKDKKRLNKIKKKHDLPDSFVLYVGDVNYNKNIPSLIAACEKSEIPLVISGKQAKEIEEVDVDIKNLSGPRDWVRYLLGKPHPELAHLKELNNLFEKNKNIKRLGFVPDEELVAIYNLATLYCQPSLYEGFGLPVLEAMACGTPVVVSRTNALVEVAGGAALIADPKDPEEIAKRIIKLLKNKDLRQKLGKKGLKRVKNFNWENTAQETIRIYGKIIDN